jgi:hypothetical protein
MRKACKSCPWTNTNPHSLNFRKWVDKVSKSGDHICHTISKDVWGLKEKSNNSNICVGRRLNDKI